MNKEKNKIPKLDLKGYERDLLIYAFRYALGRRTYAVSTIVELLKSNWDTLSEGDKWLYINEIKEYKEIYGEKGLGDLCDISSWNSVLELSGVKVWKLIFNIF